MISAATTTNPPPNLQPELMRRSAWRQQVLATLNVLIVIIAVRMILLVAVAGAIFLTYLALQSQDYFRIAVLAIYCAVVVVPVTWLCASGR